METNDIDCSFIKTRIQESINKFETGIKSKFGEDKLNEIKENLNNPDNQNKINKIIETITIEQQVFNLVLEIWRKFNIPENNSNIKFDSFIYSYTNIIS